MRILFDHQTFSRQQYGGISRYFYELITRIAVMPAHDVMLFMGLHINKFDLENHRTKMERYFGIRHPNIPHTYRVRRLLNEAMLRGFARNLHPDVYHLTYFDDTPRLGKRRVITIHDMTYERFPHFFRHNDTTPSEKQKAASIADGIVCVSECTRQDVCDMMKIPMEKTTVVYHANTLHCSVTPNNPFGYPYILYVGKRGAYKNFGTLLQAYVNSKRLRSEYHLLCFGSEKVTTAEHKFLASYKIAHRVRFVHGDDELLAQCYAHASILAYPSLAEGFGIPLLEAMYYGCPVVASDIPSLRETAADAAMYFNPASPEELGGVIEKVLENGNLREGLVHRGRARERLFSWEKSAAETIDFYHRIV